MYKKKLIETSIPLDEINAQSVREKSLRKGHPSTLHLWWARRPLAAARCVIFASMVDDPSEHEEMFATPEEQDRERERLHGIIRRLANWDNIGDEALYQEAYNEMVKYAPDGKLPEFLDPFAGGGALPLEAQRLGLVSHAADLNPIPVTLNLAMIDIPARFCGRPPVHPGDRMQKAGEWPRATGLAEDVRYYADVMREMAKERLSENYPQVDVTQGHVTKKATPIAYIWARTVTCPNPACHCETPLVRSFWLSKKKGNRAYIEPITEGSSIRYEVRYEKVGWKDFKNVQAETIGRKGGHCLYCNGPITLDYIRSESREHGLGNQLMAIVCESPFGKGRWYTGVSDDESTRALSILRPAGTPITPLPVKALSFRVQAYGMNQHWKLFTNRQLAAMVGFSDLVGDVRKIVERDAIASGLRDDGMGLPKGGRESKAYAEAVSVYLAFMVDKMADYSCSICTWIVAGETMRNLFARQAVPMAWDFAEVNPLSTSTGSFLSMSSQVADSIELLPAHPQGDSVQRDATQTEGLENLLISTDPPYYDNIGYSDLSDFFYVWLRRSLRSVFPDVFGTMLAPKTEELIATPYRFEGGANEAKAFFEDGMRKTFRRLAQASSDSYPLTVYYAYKQSEATDSGRTSSGWETMLQALMDADLQITGTWPIRTEREGRTLGLGTNALASSVVLVCRRRQNELIADSMEFKRELRETLRNGVEGLKQGSIAPVDMTQASIGPGMAAFSKYSQVIEPDGKPMTVHDALILINEQLDSLMGETGEEFDSETRFCMTWYEQFGFDKGDSGTAELLFTARNVERRNLEHAGVLASAASKTWLVRPSEAANPEQLRLDPSCWSDLMATITALESREGISGAARVVASWTDEGRGELAKSLAYILFQMAERAGRTEDATYFNDLVTSWVDISERAEEVRIAQPVQQQLDLNI